MFAVIAQSVSAQERKLDAQALQAQQTNEKLDAVQEGLRAVTQEARRFTTEQCEPLREDLAQQLVAVKTESEERAKVAEARVEQLREEVAGLRRSLEKQSDPQPAPAQVVNV